MKVFALSCCLVFVIPQPSPHFEGKIVYVMRAVDEYGIEPAQEDPYTSEVHIKGTWYKHKAVRGAIANFNWGEVVANSADSSRYNVNHTDQTWQHLGMESSSEAYLPKDIQYLHSRDSVLGYPCRKYEVTQKATLSSNDMTSYVWVAEELKLPNVSLLAEIFGYRNTLLKDGSLPGMILKNEIIHPSGAITTIEAVEILPQALADSIFVVPDTYVRQE